MAIHLLVVSGRAGSGKTSTANEMAEQLKLGGVHHANIDGDNLDAMYPDEKGPEMFLANLEAMWRNYYHLRGIRRLILSGTAMVLEMERIREVIERVTCEKEPRLVNANAIVLTTPDDVAFTRLREREIGSELEGIQKSSEKIARVLEDSIGDWARRISTCGKEVEEVALDILRCAGWIEGR